MTTKCLVVTRQPNEYQSDLDQVDMSGVSVVPASTDEEIATAIIDAEIVFGVPNLVAPHLHLADKLKWMQSSFAGIDALCVGGLRTDYLLTNVKETYGLVMAEYCFAYILSRKRLVNENAAWQSEKRWNQFEHPTCVGSTLGVAGAGSIGREIARVGKALGMTTIGLRNTPGEVDHFDRIYSDPDDFCTNKFDYLVSVLPATDETMNFFDSNRFKAINGSPMFINVGRGSAVDEDALLAAIDSGQISEALLDVFWEEPLPISSRLWTHEAVTVTPHISGYSNTPKVFEIFAENLRAYLEGGELKYKVDFSRGY